MAYMGEGALSASDRKTRLLDGQLIGGRYRVSHLLGEGGMAAVWAGTNERTGKRVALKVIRPDFMATPGAEAFLHSEGLAASRVNHPNVVTVFDLIEHEGVACIVMELLDGLPLGTYIFRSGQLSLREATTILLPAMRGVAAAHAQGVVHRDLKPQNIFVCIDPDGRVVTTKVLDFGISLMMDWAKVRAIAPIPGLVGTPAYMAPEHIEDSDRIDERADVYGFGLLLYESLTGRPPFSGDKEAEILRRVLTELPVPLRDLRPDLPASMIAIVETAMAKRPEHRFVSLNQMASEIEDLVMPATAMPASGTPPVGVPASALSYTISGPISLAVPSHVPTESSGLHRETVVYGQSPLRREAEDGSPVSEAANDWDRKPAGVVGALPVSVVPSAVSPVSGAVPIPLPPAPSYVNDFARTEIHRRGLDAVIHAVRQVLHRRIPRASRDRWILAGMAAAALVILVVTLIAGSTRGRERSTTQATPPQLTQPVAPVITVTETSRLATTPPPVPGLGDTVPPAARGSTDQAPVVLPPRPIRAEPSKSVSNQVGKRGGPRAGSLRVNDF